MHSRISVRAMAANFLTKTINQRNGRCSMTLHTHPLAWLFLFLLACAGCGKAGVAVSGTVTHNRQPVEAASILFVRQGTDGPPVRGTITNGSYRIEAEEGLQPGRYDVNISLVTRPTKKAAMQESAQRSPLRNEPVQLDHKIEITGQTDQANFEL
jgi:hypothetical protein